jgi:hypothetical protein
VPPCAMTERSSRNNHPSVRTVLFPPRRYTNHRGRGRGRGLAIGSPLVHAGPINHLEAAETPRDTGAATPGYLHRACCESAGLERATKNAHEIIRSD